MNGMKFKQIFETYYPNHLAYDWDNVGLQIGTLNKEITKILISLDLTNEVIDEAIDIGSNLIVVHHPLLFRAIKRIETDTYLGKMIEKILKNDLTIYVAHTNFDVSNYGMNMILANKLQLINQTILDKVNEDEGLGRIGKLKEAIPLNKFIQVVKDTFQLSTVRLIGELEQTVQTVAIAGGSGSSLIEQAFHSNVDIYLTGDISYHYALDAKNMGLTILDIGHNIEKYALDALQQFLIKEGVSVEITVSTTDTNPYKFV